MVFHKISTHDKENVTLLHTLTTAAEHSELKREVGNLQNSIKQSHAGLNTAYSQIKEIKKIIYDSIVKELEKRITIEAKYAWFQKEKRKIELILKKLYAANDVTYLLEIVNDIKDIVNAQENKQ